MQLFNMIVFSLCFLFLIQVHSQDVTVDTNVGTFVGIKSEITISNTIYKVSKFLGIPYAEPPVGKLRFHVPVPKAKHTGPMVVQQKSLRCLEQFPFYQLPQSEDCLYLNVVVPEKFEIEKLAVMVWIHGGGFVQGSGNEYDLEGLVGYGNVIVVSINYRLNVWGFLSTKDSNAPGNYGLWDQRLAIKWVKDNIEAFGGDTSRITISGQSAGASSVIYQGLYPGNAGLFQRMIAQSGRPTALYSHDLKVTTEDLARQVGCYNKDTAAMVDCLRYLNASVLNGAMNGANFFRFYPSIDNVFVTCDPEDLLSVDRNSKRYESARETFASFDLLSGINSGEGARVYDPAYGILNPETILPNISYFRNVLVSSFVNAGFISRLNESNVDAVANAVFDQYTDQNTIDDPYVIRLKLSDMFSDLLYLAPMQLTLKAHTKLSRKSTYMYYLSVDPTYHVLPTPSWFKRANHADDIVYIFLNASSPFVLDEQEFQLSELMVTTWTNFAKTGNPNSPRDRGVAWRQYTEPNPRYLELKRGTTSADVQEGLFEDRADFWLKVIPRITGYVWEPCKFILDTSGAHVNVSILLYTCVVLLCAHLL